MYREPVRSTGASDREHQLENMVREAAKKIREQQEQIEALSGAPWKTAQVTQVDREEGIIRFLVDSAVFEAPLPSHVEVDVGDYLRLNPDSGALVDKSPLSSQAGSVCTVQKIHENGIIEAEAGGNPRMIVPRHDLGEVGVGDRIVVAHDQFAMRNLGRSEEKFLLHGETRVSWDDIGGLESTKAAMIEALEMPYKHPKMFAAYGKKPTKGILLYGLPGNGKTLLAKAAATSVAKVHGHSASTGFISIKGPELLNMYIGNTEAAIRSIFKMGREHKEKHGYPAVLFIDEADAVLAKRGGAHGTSSIVTGTTVPQFLVEMDGMDESGCIVILATNRADVLDSAVLRDGRIDRRIHVGAPTREAVAQIVRLNLRGRPVPEVFDRYLQDPDEGRYRELVNTAVDGLFSKERVLYELHTKEGPRPFLLSNTLNGAMVTATVENAVERAFQRDRETGTVQGIQVQDMHAAVEHVFNEQKQLSHEEQLQEFVEEFRGTLREVKKVA